MKPVAFALLFLAVGLGAAAGEAPLKLEPRRFDVVRVGGKEFQGRIEKIEGQVFVFRVGGIRRRWPTSQVTVVERRASLDEVYREKSRAAGDNPALHFRLHRACLNAGLEDKAVRELRLAIRANREYLPAYQKLIELARRANDLEREVATLELAKQRRVATAPMLLREAALRVRLGLPESAVEPLQRARTMDLDNQAVRLRLAMLQLHLGRADDAEKTIRAMDARSAEAHLARGQLELSRGRTDEAVRAFQTAVVRGGSAAASACLGAIALRRGKVDDAAAHYDQALQGDRDLAPALAGAGLVAIRRGELAKARDLLDRAVAAAPRRPDVAVAAAYLAEITDDRDRALALYGKALSLDARNARAMTGAARCRMAAGEGAAARELYRKAERVDPTGLATRRGLGRALVETDPDAAERHLRAAAASDAALPEDHAALAALRLRRRRYRAAESALARVGTGNVHAAAARGFLAAARGQLDRAKIHFETAARDPHYRTYAEQAIDRTRKAQTR
ncbi:MAG: tetratricopeptide repeat protein [Planctomycetota bacterium]